MPRRPKPAAGKDNFRSASMRIGFSVNLSKAMLELLCAIADDVHWDRHIDKESPLALGQQAWMEVGHYRLTPAGECVVNLLKLAGMFVEADAAITKKSRRA